MLGLPQKRTLYLTLRIDSAVGGDNGLVQRVEGHEETVKKTSLSCGYARVCESFLLDFSLSSAHRSEISIIQRLKPLLLPLSLAEIHRQM